MATTIKTTERITVIEEVDAVVCDGCGAMSASYVWVNADGSETSVMVSSTTAKPDGSMSLYNVDLCPACFRDIIVMALLAKGIKSSNREAERAY